MRVVVVAVLCALALPAAAERALVLVDSDDPMAWRRVADVLQAEGARLPIRLPPDALLGEVPADAEGILARHGLGSVARIERASAPPLPGVLSRNARAARLALRPRPQAPGRPAPPLTHDAVEPLEGERPAVPKALPSGCDPPSATSSVLVGSVALGVLLPESLGPVENSEDWTAMDPRHPGEDRQDLVVAEIIEGCDALGAQLPQARLSFVIEVRRSVGIPLEPIEHSVAGRGGWIAATMDAVGHGAASPTGGVHGYVTGLRARHDTDWAAAAFVADDLADGDNGFPPTGFPFAYALLGGPYMVMTYDNDGWGIDRMDVVFRHELGHVFHALDEYASSGNTCSMTAGWLRVRNGNDAGEPGDPACGSPVACIMRADDAPPCAFTEGQVGTRDLDSDGVPDVLDAPPDSGFQLASPVRTESSSLTLVARATGLSVASESPHAPAGLPLHRVMAAEARLDGGAWSPLLAADGAFGGRCEDLDVVLSGLAEGWHDVEVRATDELGQVEPSPALLRVYVDADCADDPSEPDDVEDEAVVRPVGLHALHRCAHDADWSRFWLRAGASWTARLTQADASRPLRLRALDPAGLEAGGAEAVAGVAVVAGTALRTGVHRLVVEADSDHVTDYTLELVADCLDDADEPDAPAPLGRESLPGLLRGRTLCAGDEDRFLISVGAGETLGARMTFDPAFGDLDLELLDPAGAVLDASAGAGSPEIVSVIAATEGVHVVRVAGRGPADRNVYDIELEATGCVDDASENDDAAATARALAAGVTVRGTACAGDEDWFAFVAEPRRLVSVKLAHDPAAGNLDLELYADAGRRVGRSVTDRGREEIVSERLAAGRHLVRVAGTGAGRVPYALVVEQGDPLLLFVTRDPADALLRWNRSGHECFTVRRSETPSDFTGAVTTLVQEGDPSVPDGDRPIEDVGLRDEGVILDGRFLYCYLVDPHGCGGAQVVATKTADPYPVVADATGDLPEIVYEIAVRNDSLQDAFGLTVQDDLPPEAWSFVVEEIPPGAADASAPPPAGANGRGRVAVTGVDVPAGEERVVRFRVSAAGGLTPSDPMIDNQGTVIVPGTPADPPVIVVTDDPLTTKHGDPVRVMLASYAQQLLVHAFWHRDVDVDLTVTDPCGNVLAEHALTSATCSGQEGRVLEAHSCAAPSAPWRYERIGWTGFPPPPGEYVVRLSVAGEWPGDASCAESGEDEVTVVVQRLRAETWWRTLTLRPGARDVEVVRFTP